MLASNKTSSRLKMQSTALSETTSDLESSHGSIEEVNQDVDEKEIYEYLDKWAKTKPQIKINEYG